MSRIYCGNNANYTGLVNNTHRIGTNYECLRKGIGTGRNMPYDTNYNNNNYVPIDNRRFYCGNSEEIPQNGNYFAVGSPSKCLQIGIGVGKLQNTNRQKSIFIRYKSYFIYIISLIITIITFIVLYHMKPKILCDKLINPQDTKKYIYKLDIYKLILFSLSIYIIFFILLKLIFKLFV